MVKIIPVNDTLGFKSLENKEDPKVVYDASVDDKEEKDLKKNATFYWDVIINKKKYNIIFKINQNLKYL